MAFAARFLKCIWPFWDIIHYRVKQTKTREKFDEMNAVKICKYYQYKRVEESCIGKEGKRIEHARTIRTDQSEPVNKIVLKLSKAGDKYLKHRTHVDSYNAVFPLMKETYTGTFILWTWFSKMKFNSLTFQEGNLYCIVRFSTLQRRVTIIIWGWYEAWCSFC